MNKIEREKNKTVKGNFFEWLHSLTHLGYGNDPVIIIESKHERIIREYYDTGKSVRQAFNEYKKFLKTSK